MVLDFVIHAELALKTHFFVTFMKKSFEAELGFASFFGLFPNIPTFNILRISAGVCHFYMAGDTQDIVCQKLDTYHIYAQRACCQEDAPLRAGTLKGAIFNRLLSQKAKTL
jgi:hypothetical protein